MAGLNQVHVDQALTNVSVAYRNAAFVAERIFAVVPVQKKTDVYFQFSQQHFQAVADTVGPGDEANEIETDLDVRGTYDCQGHALQQGIADELRANADAGADLDIEYTQKLTEKILLNQEIALASLVTSTANITQNTTLSGTSQWSDYTNSDPVPVVDAAKETVQQAIGEFPNCLLLPRQVYRTLRNHPRILDRVKYTRNAASAGQLTPQELAEVFDVEEVIVPASLKSSVNEGQADSKGYIWGKDALLFYRPTRPGIRTPAFGYHFLWIGQGTSYMVKKFRLEGRDSDYIKAKKYYDQHIVAAGAAYLFKASIA